MSQYPGKKREGEKLSLQTGIVQKARDFQGHKHRYAQKVKNNLENGFRSWSCSLVMTFFLFLRKTRLALAHFGFSTLGLLRTHSPQSPWKDARTAQRKYTHVWLLTIVTSA